jgi:hypothetical protein
VGSIVRLAAVAIVRLAAVAIVLLPAVSRAGTSSGLYGIVTKGPTTPVCRVGVPCDAPVSVTLVASHGSTEVARVRSTRQGRYRIALPPGYYTIRSTKRVGITSNPRPHAVHVRGGHWDKIDFLFDTGIR